MTTPPMFHGFDGLMTLSRREGVDIRPTLLRVLTDLYVQTSDHTLDEERQFAELATRLIDEVDDATRAAVRARLAIYPNTPREIAWKLQLKHTTDSRVVVRDDEHILDDTLEIDPAADFEIVSDSEAPAAPILPAPTLSMQPDDAAKLIDMFLAADKGHRAQMLYGLTDTPLKPSTPVDPRRAARAVTALEQAALAADSAGFAAELADALILTSRVATQIVNEPGGEPLACALKALGMPGESYQRVLLFLNPSLGASVMEVYRLARLYEVIELRTALIMLAAWRGSALATTRAKYRPALYDDERQRARSTSRQSRPAAQPATRVTTRNTSRG
ncbi:MULTISPECIES: DUF2336 domain-containing protein [unclassified Afipia]|uniref:DUF2336 domain-containing protein n=1 Tax=unclassified Afipia TaxID=2642050 RepID=UPI000466453D|nr:MULTISPECIES: DUF2336 domain-containing protein [unclassified Afipia]MAH72244.1 DUF2336 domain-containing protein [Afipia sp.]OUX58843.1 MAG: DUF2336 domain-containing protein [Afipia sp. TMED4]HAO41290.1 DUF2336 domain-containing protein [Afipia sp.]HAP13223.1 DUF2336 domain-containing protein [Afipia sp.]HAP46413.1 DUF2336 domain-containing protein [Afipia sp.]